MTRGAAGPPAEADDAPPAEEAGAPRGRIFPGPDRALLWFVRNRFQLWEALAAETRERPATAASCQRRFARALRQAQRLLVVRLVVTVLLALGLVASVASAVLAATTPAFLAAQADAFERLLTRAAALATSVSALLLVLRLLLERALSRYDVVVAFFAPRIG